MPRDVPLAELAIGERHRRDMGDLAALANSMRELGLLQPIGITEDRRLVFGERRVKAAEMLGWATISARIIHVSSIVAGEYAENEIRKDFTPSERVAIRPPDRRAAWQAPGPADRPGTSGQLSGSWRREAEAALALLEAGIADDQRKARAIREALDIAWTTGACPTTRLTEALARAAPAAA